MKDSHCEYASQPGSPGLRTVAWISLGKMSKTANGLTEVADALASLSSPVHAHRGVSADCHPLY